MDHPYQSNHGPGNNRAADPPRNAATEALETAGRQPGVLALHQDGNVVEPTADEFGPTAVYTADDGGIPEDYAGREIMASLPRRRPQRPSLRRRAAAVQSSSTPARGSGPAAVSSEGDQSRRGLRLVPPERPMSGTALRAARRRTRLVEHDLQPPAGLAQLAVDGVVEAAKLPLRAGAQLTSIALGAVTRGIRR